MISSLWALALNPNLSEKQFIDIANEAVEAKIKQFDIVEKKINSMPNIEDRIKYFNQCLPILMM